MIVGIIFGNFKFNAPKVVKFNFFNNFYKLLNSVPLRQTYPNIVPHILAQKMKEIEFQNFRKQLGILYEEKNKINVVCCICFVFIRTSRPHIVT